MFLKKNENVCDIEVNNEIATKSLSIQQIRKWQENLSIKEEQIKATQNQLLQYIQNQQNQKQQFVLNQQQQKLQLLGQYKPDVQLKIITVKVENNNQQIIQQITLISTQSIQYQNQIYNDLYALKDNVDVTSGGNGEDFLCQIHANSRGSRFTPNLYATATYLQKITKTDIFHSVPLSSCSNSFYKTVQNFYDVYLDFFNLFGVNEQLEIVKFDFTNITYKRIKFNTAVEQQGSGIQVSQGLLKINCNTPQYQIEYAKDGAQVETQDGLIRPELLLKDFEKYVGPTYQVFEEMITEGKQYTTLTIYQKYFQKEKKYCGVVIFEKLLGELMQLIQICPVQEVVQEVEEKKQNIFNLTYLREKPIVQLYDGIRRLVQLIKEYPQKIQQPTAQQQKEAEEKARKMQQEAEEKAKLEQQNEIKRLTQLKEQEIDNQQKIDLQKFEAQQKQELEQFKQKLPEVQKQNEEKQMNQQLQEISKTFEKEYQLKTLGILRKVFGQVKLKEKKETEKEKYSFSTQQIEMEKEKGVLTTFLYKQKDEKHLDSSQDNYDPFQAKQLAKQLRGKEPSFEYNDEVLGVEYNQKQFKNSVEILHHIMKENQVVSLVLPVNDRLSPFVKDSKLWKFAKPNIILIPWYTEKLVNIVLIHMDNTEKWVFIQEKSKSEVVFPAIPLKQKQVFKNHQDKITSVNMGTEHNSFIQKEGISLLDDFTVDDALYVHCKYSKTDRIDVLYTNESDPEKMREIHQKGMLMADYVGFEIQTCQLGSVEKLFGENKKYITNNNEEDIIILVGDNVMTNYEKNNENLDVEKMKMFLQENTEDKIQFNNQEEVRVKGQQKMQNIQLKIQAIEKKLEKVKIDQKEPVYIFDSGNDKNADQQIDELGVIVDKIVDVQNKNEYQQQVLCGVKREIEVWKQMMQKRMEMK